MKIAYLGAGTWGFCLARLLAANGHTVVSWSREKELVDLLSRTKEHPRLPDRPIIGKITFTDDLKKTIEGADIIVESVTSAGVRPVFEEIKKIGLSSLIPIVIASKGIEQNSGLILPEVVISILGESHRPFVACLSGPSFAEEVSHNLPTSVVCGVYNADTAKQVVDCFTTTFFRVYPNSDIRGVAFGGALKNIIAIACGISDGMQLGTGARAALMTRGLHEMVKLARFQGCRQETLYGLSGMGDLFLTCSSINSRNYRFGKLISQGEGIDEAKREIGMVVEGAYTCVSALQLSLPINLPMPISEAVFNILEGKISPREAVPMLMLRSIKEEYL